GLAAWRYTKPGLIAEINSLANQLQISIPGLPG
ncbi:DNA-binding protein, partial [Escherichia coli]